MTYNTNQSILVNDNIIVNYIWYSLPIRINIARIKMIVVLFIIYCQADETRLHGSIFINLFNQSEKLVAQYTHYTYNETSIEVDKLLTKQLPGRTDISRYETLKSKIREF